MKTKSLFLSMLAVMMVSVMSISLVSCGGDDDGDGYETTPTVSDKDPDGTISLNMNNGARDNWYDIGIGSKIHIDAANNFVGDYSDVKFVSLGKVSGLSKITSIPTTGWSKSAAVVPGNGYVARYGSTYARIYVVSYSLNVAEEIIGATIKYQSPFQLPIKLDVTALTFTSEAGSQTLLLENPTDVMVEEKPDWCNVTPNNNTVMLDVMQNLTAEQRTGDIVLKNTANTVTVKVTQKGSSSPLFQAGSGTADDPYQIKTAKQLESISQALNAHFLLTADINLTSYLNANGSGWDAIGKQESPFTGTFDGQGHSIKGLWMKRPTTNRVGLFGTIQGAAITNVRVEIGTNGLTGGDYVGGICGYMTDGSSISKCSVKGDLAGSRVSGGICGASSKGRYSPNNTISECYSEGEIRATSSYASGIIGNASGSATSISDCYSTASLISSLYYCCYGIGDDSGNTTRCYYAGKASQCYSFECSGSYTYYDSGIIGTTNINNTSNARTTAQMMTQSNYEGWDFNNTWKITEGKSYPTLRCFD